MDSGSDSDGAPEELTAVQGVEKHEEISQVEKDSAIRCVSYAYFTAELTGWTWALCCPMCYVELFLFL
uniref:Uncharacterized protein n=1 Tax=Zea mays TaxID=4577 RepID=B6U347_MAIZE|nr:hypothetical protein [Zea mays]